MKMVKKIEKIKQDNNIKFIFNLFKRNLNKLRHISYSGRWVL